jgi:tetratricopeptide (TPR) repeat protein
MRDLKIFPGRNLSMNLVECGKRITTFVAILFVCAALVTATGQARAVDLEDALVDFSNVHQLYACSDQKLWDEYEKIIKDAAFHEYVYSILGEGDSKIPLLRQWVAAALFRNGMEQIRQGEFAQAIALFDELEQRFAKDIPISYNSVPDDSVSPQEWAAAAQNNKGAVLARQGKFAEAVAVYDELMERYGIPHQKKRLNAWREEYAAQGKSGKQGEEASTKRQEEAAIPVEILAQIFVETKIPVEMLVGLSKEGLKRYLRYDIPPHGWIAAAAAAFNKGQILRKQGRFAEAIALYDENFILRKKDGMDDHEGEVDPGDFLATLAQVERELNFPTDNETDNEIEQILFWRLFIKAQISKAEMLEQQGESEAALALYEEIGWHFSAWMHSHAAFNADAVIQEYFVKAWIKKTNAYSARKESRQVVVNANDIFSWGWGYGWGAKFRNNPVVQEMLFTALLEWARTTQQNGDLRRATNLYQTLYGYFGEQKPEVREIVFSAFLELAKTAARQGQLAEETGDADAQDYQSMEMALYEEIYARFGRDREPLMRARVDQMLRDLLARAEQQQAVEDEADCYDLACARYIRALLDDAHLENAEDAEETAAMADKPYHPREKNEPEPVRESLSSLPQAEAIHKLKPMLIALLLDPPTRVDTDTLHDEIEHRFGGDNDPEVQKQVARSLLDKGSAHFYDNRIDEAIAVYDEVIRRFGNDAGSVAAALANSAEAALVLGRKAEFTRRAETLRASADASKTDKAVMSFLIWLADPETPLQSVQDAMYAASDEAYRWSFTKVRPLIDALPEKRKNQAACFVAYLERSYRNRQSEKWLQECLEEQ